MPIPTSPGGAGAGIGLFFIHSVSVETFAGSGAYGPAYTAPVDIPCFVDDGYRLVRDATGEEVSSSATVYAPLSQVDLFAIDSRVTLNARVAHVIAVSVRSSGLLGLPDHVEVHLT